MKLLSTSAFVFASVLAPAQPASWEKEVIYQVFERSFYDSNGDRNGDFSGIAQKLGYIKGLGATAILLQPTFKSRVYHNYFADSFWQTDPTLGTNKQFFDMVHAAHLRHIKVILDMEVQYVAGNHPWYIAAQKHPDSSEAKRLISKSGIFGLGAVSSYTGLKVPIATVNTNEPSVLAEIKRVFRYWAAPPGRAQDGVDGFRLDHMMDDLDNNHKDVDMFESFWTPIENEVRKAKPGAFFVAEQSDWSSYGADTIEKGNVDAAYALPLHFAFVKAFEPPKPKEKPYTPGDVQKALEGEKAATPEGKSQLLVIEDHDVERYASLVHGDARLLRLGAVFVLTAKGTPSIYYGQELGMKGIQLHGKTDGNDIPVRLAFRWTHSLKSRGTASWYGSGPWNTPANSADKDGISVEEENRNPKSLLNFYRRMIRLRQSTPALTQGSETVIETSDPNVVAYLRSTQGSAVLVLLNMSPRQKDVKFKLNEGEAKSFGIGHSVHLDGYAYRLIVARRVS